MCELLVKAPSCSWANSIAGALLMGQHEDPGNHRGAEGEVLLKC